MVTLLLMTFGEAFDLSEDLGFDAVDIFPLLMAHTNHRCPGVDQYAPGEDLLDFKVHLAEFVNQVSKVMLDAVCVLVSLLTLVKANWDARALHLGHICGCSDIGRCLLRNHHRFLLDEPQI